MESGTSQDHKHVFLSPEWVREVTRVVQLARRTDENFGRLANGFSLNLVYLITDIPQELREQYDGSSQAVIFVELDRGVVRRIQIGTELPSERVDFTVASNYNVAQQIFQGELNVATSFINKQLKVEPWQEVYRRPSFAAKSVVTGNLMLKIARQVSTEFPAGA